MSSVAFTIIRTCNDARLFSNRVVAYRTESSYFVSDHGIKFNEHSLGYLQYEMGIEIGNDYHLHPLINLEGIPNPIALSDAQLAKTQVLMRLATQEEAEFIWREVEADRAKFGFLFNKEKILSILEKHLWKS